MNINFKLNKDEESIIVSDENGLMEIREYQDNIRDILILEDVIAEQKSDLELKKIYKETYDVKLNDICLKIEKKKKKWKLFKRCFCSIILVFPVFFCCFLKLLAGTKLAFISSQTLIGDLKLGCIIDLAIVINYVSGCIASDFRPSLIKKLVKDKEDFLNLSHNLDLEIPLLEQLLDKNRDKLQDMLEIKEKNNIENMSTEVQFVSYREELEAQRKYLMSINEPNIISEKEAATEQNEMILGRLKRKRNRN